MQRLYFLAIFVLSLAFEAMGQVDQVSVGPAYTEQAYYHLSDGTVATMPNKSWDISFTAFGVQDAGVFINEAAALGGTPLELYLYRGGWSDIIDPDNLLPEDRLHNDEVDHANGAMNMPRDPASPFDYGWGMYSPQTNTVEGNRVFVLRDREGSYLKMRVVNLVAGVYTVEYADLDNDNAASFSISKDDAVGGMLHYSFASGNVVEVPADYDLLFTRYHTVIPDGDGVLTDYTVTGVLSAPGVMATPISGQDPYAVAPLDYQELLSSRVDAVGYDWKEFDFNQGWIVYQDQSYLIQTVEGDLYHIIFLDFEGSSTGVTTVEKVALGTVSTTQEDYAVDINIYPNPATDYLTISSGLDRLRCDMYSVTGQQVISKTVLGDGRIDVSDMVPGPYHLVLSSANGVVATHTIVVNH